MLPIAIMQAPSFLQALFDPIIMTTLTLPMWVEAQLVTQQEPAPTGGSKLLWDPY